MGHAGKIFASVRVPTERETEEHIPTEWRERVKRAAFERGESCLRNGADVVRVTSSRSAAHRLPLLLAARQEAGAGRVRRAQPQIREG